MTDRQTCRTMTEKMFKKRIEIKKHTDRKFRVISCTTVITVKTQIADTYAQLGGCCSSSVGVNKTLTHFSSRCQS